MLIKQHLSVYKTGKRHNGKKGVECRWRMGVHTIIKQDYEYRIQRGLKHAI